MTLRWCHTGAMDLSPYVEGIRRELAVAAEAGGDDARALAERLTAPLESAVRLMLLEALSAAADEVTRELAPGSVELRLRSGEPDSRSRRRPASRSTIPSRRQRRRLRRPTPTRAPRRASTSVSPSTDPPRRPSRRPCFGDLTIRRSSAYSTRVACAARTSASFNSKLASLEYGGPGPDR